jgi:hypothetical protein
MDFFMRFLCHDLRGLRPAFANSTIDGLQKFSRRCGMVRILAICSLMIGSLSSAGGARGEDRPAGCAVYLAAREPSPTDLPRFSIAN